MPKKLATAAFYVAVVVFVGFYLRSADLAGLMAVRPSLGALAAALVIGTLMRFCQPALWAALIAGFGVEVRRYREYNAVYAHAWMGRYVPGKVAMLAARLFLADSLGIKKSIIVASSALEIASQLWVGGVVGVVGVWWLAQQLDLPGIYRPATLALLAITGTVLVPPVFNRIVGLLQRRLGVGDQQPVRIAWRNELIALTGFFLHAALGGVYVVTVVGALAPVAWDNGVFVWGAYSLSAVLGIVALFAPSGLGVREAVQLPLFGLIMPSETAAIVVVALRVSDLLIDLCFWGLSSLWRWSADTRQPSADASRG